MFALVSTGIRRTLPFVRIVRLRPFDVSTPEGRSKERHRRAALTALATALSQIITIGTALISVPLTLHYLGAERYGMWMTMSSVIAMLTFADFGIGNGILNAVSAAYGKDDYQTIRDYVAGGYFILSVIALAVLILFCASYEFVHWYRVFNVTSPSARTEAGPALAVLVICFALAIPLTVVQRVQLGMQRGFMASLWMCAGSLMALAGIIIAVILQAGLPYLVLAVVGSPLIAALANTYLFFAWLEPDLAPRRLAFEKKAVREVAHIGLLFFVLQISYAVIFSSDNIVIAQFLGAVAVTSYAVPQRLFSLVSMVLNTALSPLWPAYGEAISRGDHAWVRRTFRRSFVAAVSLALLAATILAIGGRFIIHHWVGDSITATPMLLLGLAIFQVIQAAGSAFSMLLNGANVVVFQVARGMVTAVVAIVLKVEFVQTAGISGVIWATNLAFIVCSLIPTLIYVRKWMK